jgi:hypothetical protein
MADKYLKRMKKVGPSKEAAKAVRLNKNLISIKSLIDAADTSRKALRRQADAIKKNKAMSFEVKKEKLERIEKQTMANYRKILLKAVKLGIEV